MTHSFASLLVHAVFSTKDRQPTLVPALSTRLFPYLGGIVREMKGSVMAVNGPPYHVHLLLRLRTDISVADTLRILKTNSSRWVHQTFPERRDFAWQRGYGAFSVSSSKADDVRGYIATQEEHHRTASFQDKFVTLLTKHGIVYDSRAVWA